MSSTVEEPSQAERRLEDVAVAGVGADVKENVSDRLSDKAPNGSVNTPSDASDVMVEAKADAGPEEKPTVPPQAPERSKAKVALIMASLMVRETEFGKSECERTLLIESIDRCLSCRSRYCESCAYHSLLFPLTST